MNIFLKKYKSEIKIFIYFIFFALLTVLLHLLFHPVRVLNMDTSIFYMDEKYAIAAFFSTITAFLVGFISLININLLPKKTIKRISAIGYGLLFIILSIDEYFEIHEFINDTIKNNLKTGNLIKTLSSQSWIFPLIFIIAIVFTLLFIKVKSSPSDIKKVILIGTFCFSLVLIFELFGSVTYGQNIYVYFIAIEEGLEMIGVSFFLLASLIENKLNQLKINKF